MEHFTKGLIDLTVYLVNLIKEYGVLTVSFLITFTMAMLRTKKQDGKFDLIESLMCSIFTMGAWSILIYMNMPETLAVGVGAYIGHLGTIEARKKFEQWWLNGKRND